MKHIICTEIWTELSAHPRPRPPETPPTQGPAPSPHASLLRENTSNKGALTCDALKCETLCGKH